MRCPGSTSEVLPPQIDLPKVSLGHFETHQQCEIGQVVGNPESYVKQRTESNLEPQTQCHQRHHERSPCIATSVSDPLGRLAPEEVLNVSLCEAERPDEEAEVAENSAGGHDRPGQSVSDKKPDIRPVGERKVDEVC